MTAVRKGLVLLILLPWTAPAQVAYNVTLFGHMDKYHNMGWDTSFTYSATWGWTGPDGREYAFIGTARGSSIVDITDSLHEVALIPGPASYHNYHEFRTYGNILYIVADGFDSTQYPYGGVEMVDLSHLPDSASLLGTYVWQDTANGIVTLCYKSHTVAIEGKYLYLHGGEFGGLRVLDLTNPLHPRQAGSFGRGSQPYIHGSYPFHDTDYAACNVDSLLDILDARTKSSITLISRTHVYPEGNVHSTWVTPDGKYVLLTTETVGGHLHIFDISDPVHPAQVSEWSSSPTSTSHEIVTKGDFAYLSYYGEGLRILDISDIRHPIEVGFYDTHPGPDHQLYEGDWGVDPLFPSGKIAVSDINTGLYVFTFNGKHGGRMTGYVRSADSDAPLDSVVVSVAETGRTYRPGPDGAYEIGAAEGTLTVSFARPGYATLIDTMTIRAGKLDSVNVYLGRSGVVSVAQQGKLTPYTTALEQNYPNPFNPATEIRYTLASAGWVHLTIYDVLGRLVDRLVDAPETSGPHIARFDGSRLSSGVYFCRLAAGDHLVTRKMILAR